MESELKKAIWTPAEKPVVLDKFCHLSLDAQRVMASMYRDFHQKKSEIINQISKQKTAQRGYPDRHYFSDMPVSVPDQKRGSFQELRHVYLPARTPCGYQEQNDLHLGFQEIRRMGAEGQKANTSQDFNFNIESPAVETRDFQILSQFNVDNTQVELFSDLENNSLDDSKVDDSLSISFNDTVDTCKPKKGVDSSSVACFSEDSVYNGRNANLGSADFELVDYKKTHSRSYNARVKSMSHSSSFMLEKLGSNHYDSTTYGVHFSEGDSTSTNQDLDIPLVPSDICCMGSGSESCTRDEGLSEESPYLDRTSDVHILSNERAGPVIQAGKDNHCQKKDNTCKKSGKLKQMKIMFGKLRSENKEIMDSTCAGDDGDRNPVKKPRLSSLTGASSTSTCFSSNTIYMKDLTLEDTKLVCSEILDAEEIALCLVFTNGCTQLRDNLFGTGSKIHKKQIGKVKKDSDVSSIALWKPDTPKSKVYLFSKEGDRPDIFEKLSHNELLLTDMLRYNNRLFWSTLLSRDNIRKIGFQTKEIILELFSQYGFDYNRVDLSWTLLDAGIAVWLLDPDRHISSFDQLLLALNISAQTPNKSCIDALHGDMTLLISAMKKLYKMLQSKGMWTLFVCLETKLVTVLAGMERREISISIHTLLQFSSILKKSLSRLEEEAHKAAGHAFLLNSHHQLRQVLFEELKLDSHLSGKSRLATTSVTRETSTAESVLTQLQPFHSLPAIILEYRQLQKLKSTYVDGILSCASDSYLTTHWDQTSAVTGRLTSHHPNIQAIPKVPVTIKDHQTNFIVSNQPPGPDDAVLQFNARDPFISRPDWSLLAADFQQIELRLMSHLSEDPVLINVFTDTNIPDIFNALSAQWLGKDIREVTETDREQTKRVVYSVIYGVGKERLADYLKCTPENAKAIMDSFLLKFPAVNQFTKSCVDFCQRNGYTCSIFKRRRLFPNIRHRNAALRAQAERQCVNFCVQGSAADICKAAMLQVENALAENSGLNARLLVQIHDELLLEVADLDLQEVTELVKNVMESEEKLCGSIVKLKVPIPVTVSVGKKWGHMEPVLAATNED